MHLVNSVVYFIQLEYTLNKCGCIIGNHPFQKLQILKLYVHETQRYRVELQNVSKYTMSDDGAHLSKSLHAL